MINNQILVINNYYTTVSHLLLYINSILTGCYDNTLKLWRTNGDNLLTLSGHTNAVKSVKWITKGRITCLFF